MVLLRNLWAAARPLADERPPEPLVRRRQIAPTDRYVMTMEASSCHRVMGLQPLRWADAARMIDHLRREGITVFQLSFLPPGLAKRMLDFLCGAALMERAGLYRIARQTYLLTPRGVSVDEPLLRRLEQEGFYVRDSQTRQRLA